MFKRIIILTSFNGFANIKQQEKWKLANALNEMYNFNDVKARPTMASLDCVYRSTVFNTASPASMKRYNSLINGLKEAKSKGITIEVFELEELKFASLPVENRYVFARLAAEKSFTI